MQKTKIEWTDSTWNPLRGCSRVSEGCRNCYAESMAARFSGKGQPYEGLAMTKDFGPQWTGEVRLVKEHLDDPLRWRRPRKIFVNSMSDLFHESVSDRWIDEIFAVMALATRHTFIVLTKRPQRMQQYLSSDETQRRIIDIVICRSIEERDGGYQYDEEASAQWIWPLPNVWAGASIENQSTANERLPFLLETPAAVRLLSCEPLLERIDFYTSSAAWYTRGYTPWLNAPILHGIDWVIVGGESGSDARPMHPEWARTLRDQCVASDTKFFFKQWGEYAPISPETAMPLSEASKFISVGANGQPSEYIGGGAEGMWRAGKKRAGRVLDGREWSEYPEVQHG